MTTLVTGGTGFLGRFIVRRLVEDGEPVRVLARSFDAELHSLGVEFIDGSLLKEDDLARAVDGVRRVFHLAGRVERDPEYAHRMYRLHVDGTRKLLNALKGSAVEKIVVASTSGTVGVGEDESFMGYDDSAFTERIVRRWPYYLSKIYAERVCDEFVRDHDMPIVQMRPSLLLGPEDFRESSTGDVVSFLQRRIPSILGGGISFVDVRDAADAFVRAMDDARPGEKYLLGGANMTMVHFFEELEAISGVPAPKRTLPSRTAELGARLLGSAAKLVGSTPTVHAESVQMGQCFWYIDSSKAKSHLGFRARDPRATIRDTVRWIERNHPDFAGRREQPEPGFVKPETLKWAERRPRS